jgi:archaellum biogenesis ATPase FlaH
MSVLDQALKYAQSGLSVIQVGQDKRPIVKWQEFQERIATAEEITDWYKWLPNANVGIVTGKISNLTVVDVEKGGDITKWPETFTVKTGGGGYHLYYKYCEGVRNGTRICELTDIRSEGGLVVAPPSLHASGMTYEVVKRVKMVEFPLSVYKSVSGQRSDTGTCSGNILTGVGEGSRNEAAAKMSGIILKIVRREDYHTIGWNLLVAWNRGNNPPLEEQELQATYQSIAKREFSKIGLEVEGETDVVHISEAITSEEYSVPTSIGYPVLDQAMMGGVREGDLVIITGKSGEGKTTFAQNITLNLFPVGGLSTWLSYEVMVNNLYAKFRQMSEAKRLDIKSVPIFTPRRLASGNLTWVKERIAESIQKYNAKFVFIDHLDFISPTNLKSGDQRRMILKDICQELKTIAIELKITVFLMAHVKKVQGREIEMQDLAESSGIYQLADYVFSVQRIYKKDNVGGVFIERLTDESVVKILKNRMTGDQPFMKFLMTNNIIQSLSN